MEVSLYGLILSGSIIPPSGMGTFRNTTMSDFSFARLAITAPPKAKIECSLYIGNQFFDLGMIDTWARRDNQCASAYVHQVSHRVRRGQAVSVRLTNHWNTKSVEPIVYAHGILLKEDPILNTAPLPALPSKCPLCHKFPDSGNVIIRLNDVAACKTCLETYIKAEMSIVR